MVGQSPLTIPSHRHVENSHPLGQCENNLRSARLYARILSGIAKNFLPAPPILHLSTYSTYYISPHVQYSPNCFTYYIMNIFLFHIYIYIARERN